MLGGRSSCPGGNIYVWPFLPPAACHCQFPREAGRWLIGSCAVHALTALNRPTKEDRPCSHHLEKNRIGIVTKGNTHGCSMLPSDGHFSEATVPLAKTGARCCWALAVVAKPWDEGIFLEFHATYLFKMKRQYSIQRTTLGLVIKLIMLERVCLSTLYLYMQVSKIFCSFHQLIDWIGRL